MDELLTTIQDPELRQAYTTWRSYCPDPGHLPAVGQLDPTAFMNLLGRLSVIELERWTEAVRFRYRLQGVAVPIRTGPLAGEWAKDWTGRYLDQVAMPQFVGTASRWYGRVAKLHRPAWRVMSGTYDDYQLQDYEVLALPWGAGQRVDRLLVASRPLRPDAASLWASGDPTGVDLYHSRLV